MAKSIVKVFSVLLPFKHLRKKIHPYYTIIIKKIKEKLRLIYRGKFTLRLIKKNEKTNHNHKEKYAKYKFPKVLCSYAILYNDIILQTSSYKKKSTINDSTLD